MMEYTDDKLKAAGMKCLVEALGPVDAQRFISIVNRSDFDYTIQRRALFDNMTHEEIVAGIEAYRKDNPLSEDFMNRLKSLV